MTKKHEEWEMLGTVAEKLVALAAAFQELKLALVHREMQRIADDEGIEIVWCVDKAKRFREKWQQADIEGLELFTFEGRPFRVTLGRYLVEYLEYLFGDSLNG